MAKKKTNTSSATKHASKSVGTSKVKSPPATAAAAKNTKRSNSAAKVTKVGKKKVSKPVTRAAPVPPIAEAPLEPQPEPPSITQLRKVKTGLSKKDLDHYRDLLTQKRNEILGDVEALETDARTDSGDHHSPEHMADIGSINYEQEFTLVLVASERRLLMEIHEALARIVNGTYGVCLENAVPIGRSRLDAKPWAKYCIEVVREKERLGQL